MFYIGQRICFDGYRTPGGEPITIADNPGAWLNHQRFGANCKPVAIRTTEGLRMVIMTKRHIAQHEQLTWNYGDTRHNLEPWMYY